MPAVHYSPFLAIILLVQCYLGAADFTFPPLFDACREKNCGKGNCVASSNSTFGFECECKPGWRQARPEDDEHFKFLPCVIPNCTLNTTCAKAPAPPPNNLKKANLSFFDPCSSTDCGGGSCKKTSLFTHACECEEGYYNLFNSTTFPCYKECAIGLNCARLGLVLMNSSTLSPPPSPPPDDGDDDDDDGKVHGLHPFGHYLT